MNLYDVKKALEHELEMAGLDGEQWCCVDTDDMHAYIEAISSAIKSNESEAECHGRLKSDSWDLERRLMRENAGMRSALQRILAMQTRGFITLGESVTLMASAALQPSP